MNQIDTIILENLDALAFTLDERGDTEGANQLYELMETLQKMIEENISQLEHGA